MLNDVIADNQVKIVIRKLAEGLVIRGLYNSMQFSPRDVSHAMNRLNTPMFTVRPQIDMEASFTAPYLKNS